MCYVCGYSCVHSYIGIAISLGIVVIVERIWL